jgi:hypothetical protein
MAVLVSLLLSVLIIPACSQDTATGTLILEDDFSNPGSGWEVYNTQQLASAAYVKGEYVLTLVKKIVFQPVALNNVGDIDNYAVEVEARCLDAKIDASSMGIVFGRQDKANLYYFYVEPATGKYSIGNLVASEWSDVVPATPCAAIKKDNETNRLRLKVQGSSVTPYINGTALPLVNIPALHKGQPGLAIQSALFIPRSYAFDNFRLFDLPAAGSASAPAQSVLLQGKKLVPVYEDDFSKCDGSWTALRNMGKAECGSGMLKAYSSDKGAGMVIYKGGWQVSDFMAEVDVKQISGDESDYCGIVFRFNGSKGVIFGIADSQYMLLRLPGTTDFVRTWKKSQYIKPSREANRIKIICVGKMIEVFANGNLLGTFSDDSSLKGLLLLGISGDPGSVSSYSIDDFKLYEIR